MKLNTHKLKRNVMKKPEKQSIKKALKSNPFYQCSLIDMFTY
ncbi:hypothetical protein D042_4602 [Vibrio parahaemolyticus NIHCB0757]|nr:hypothetical protein D042_4602 [Vibrio parahaemolyticus NIHCB0757]